MMPLEAFGATGYNCSYCHTGKESMTVWAHTAPLSSWGAIAKGDVHAVTTRILYLCFRGCQHFPDPFEATGCSDRDHWRRVDVFQGVKRAQPRIGKRDWRDS